MRENFCDIIGSYLIHNSRGPFFGYFDLSILWNKTIKIGLLPNHHSMTTYSMDGPFENNEICNMGSAVSTEQWKTKNELVHCFLATPLFRDSDFDYKTETNP